MCRLPLSSPPPLKVWVMEVMKISMNLLEKKIDLKYKALSSVPWYNGLAVPEKRVEGKYRLFFNIFCFHFSCFACAVVEKRQKREEGVSKGVGREENSFSIFITGFFLKVNNTGAPLAYIKTLHFRKEKKL